MKALLFTLSAVAGLMVSTGSAMAQMPAGGPVVPASASFVHPGHGMGFSHGMGFGHGMGGHGMGHSGFLSGLFSNHGHPWDRRGPGTTLPVATTGTLVFPQNPFVRSPRDFFMK
jgi:hypothetical protein